MTIIPTLVLVRDKEKAQQVEELNLPNDHSTEWVTETFVLEDVVATYENSTNTGEPALTLFLAGGHQLIVQMTPDEYLDIVRENSGIDFDIE